MVLPGDELKANIKHVGMRDGHIVVNTTNGQEGLNTIEEDHEFDCVLMDIQ